MKEAVIAALSALPDDVTIEQMVAIVRALERPVSSADPPKLYPDCRRYVSLSVTVLSGLAAVVTIGLIAVGAWTSSKEDRATFLCIYAFWTLAPPLWFFVEYVWLFDSLRGNSLRVADFNTAQSLAAKIWAALVVFLGVFALITWGIKF